MVFRLTFKAGGVRDHYNVTLKHLKMRLNSGASLITFVNFSMPGSETRMY